MKKQVLTATVSSPPQRGGKGSETAFTMVEVMVAILLLTTITVAFYGALASGCSVLQTTREDLRATQILTQKTEAIRLCTWSQLANVAFREFYDPLGATNGSGGVCYYGKINIGPATDIPNTSAYFGRMCLVTVNLSWTNYNGTKALPHQRQMQTEVARYGLQHYLWGAIK
jgi:hypothetical protein